MHVTAQCIKSPQDVKQDVLQSYFLHSFKEALDLCYDKKKIWYHTGNSRFFTEQIL